MLKRRTLLKWLHWLSLALIFYFLLIEPEGVTKSNGAALATHAGLGLVLGLIALVWTGIYLRKGLASRPGPKLPTWARRFHSFNHRLLYVALPLMVFTGAATGFAAPYVIYAFGILPINPGFDAAALHKLLEDIHEVAFNLLLAAVTLHAIFHLWRHTALRDNALRIMAPKIMHRWL